MRLQSIDQLSSHLAQLLFFLVFCMISFFLSIPPAQAQGCPANYTCQGGCTAPGQCVGNVRCIVLNGGSGNLILTPGSLPCGSALVGEVIPPKGVARYNLVAMQSGGTIGLLLFISNAIKLFAVVCGIIVFVNFLYSGYLYITGAGSADTHTKVRERLTWSILGLVLLIAAYMAISLFSLLIFDDAGFILNPDLTSYGALAPP